jgi:hypothetical protein
MADTNDEKVAEVPKTYARKTSPSVRKLKAVEVAPIKVRVDGNTFVPVGDGTFGFEFRVGPESEEFSIPPRMCFTLDGGMELDVPKGARVHVQVNQEWSKRGLILMSNTYGFGPQRLTAMAHNVGKQILAFGHGEVVGKFWFSGAAKVGLVPQK